MTRDSLSQSLPYNHFSNVHNVFVSASHEGIYLPQGSNGKPVFFFLEFKLLERDDIPGLFIAGTEDNPIRSLLDLVQPFIVKHGTSWKDGRVVHPWRNAYTM